MKVSRQILRTHPLLSLIPGFTLRRLLKDSTLAEHPKGTVVFEQGDPCNAIYLIVSGRCESRKAANGRSQVDQVFGPGDLLGEREFLSEEAYRTTVRVITDSLLLRLEGDQLRELFTQKPHIAGRFSHRVGDRLRKLRERRTGEYPRLRRIVSMLSLSDRIGDAAVVRRVAAAIHRLVDQSVLLAHFSPREGTITLSAWAQREHRTDAEFRFQGELQTGGDGFEELTIHVEGARGEADCVAPMLSHFGVHFDYVIIHLERNLTAEAAVECMIQSDLGFVLIEPSTENLYDYDLLRRRISDQTKCACTHVRALVYAESETPVSNSFNTALKEAGQPPHVFVRGFPLAGTAGTIDRPGNFPLHVNRLAREITRRRVGLALSSGSAKGLAHIGVIQILEENGIEVDLVAGSSMGAYVGSVWCSGHDGEMLEKTARLVEGRWGWLSLVHPVFPPRKGFLKADRIVRRLRRSIGDMQFCDLAIPLRVVATYLDTLERVVFSTGDVGEAVSASIAIPGISVPAMINGEALIDGGIADPLPVDVLREAGIERVIAVNTIPTPETVRFCYDMERESADPDARRHFIRETLNTHLNYFARGNILDIMMRAIHGVQMRVAETSCKDADLVLRPVACESRWHDFGNPGKYIALGRKVAEEQLPEILDVTQRNQHEKQTGPVALTA